MLIFVLFVMGAILGSFLTASAWRLRACQLASNPEEDLSTESEVLIKQNSLHLVATKTDFSRCLHCGYRLRFFDLIPVLSWLSLGGKCRKCRQPIGWVEFFIECLSGLVFMLSFVFWPFDFTLNGSILFCVWLIITGVFLLLFVYDLKWMELPSSLLYVGIVLSFIFWILKTLMFGVFNFGVILNLILALLILAGVYWSLSFFSREKLVGSGDAFLGVSLGFLLADWKLAFLTLFAANLIGVFLAIPLIFKQKKSLKFQVPLGPLLIFATWLLFWFGAELIKIFNF